MEYRFLGRSGFKVPVLGFGGATFGGNGPLYNALGSTQQQEAKRLVDICLERGVNLFDTADIYSDGDSERILGAALKGRRDQAIISTKVTLRSGEDANAVGASRFHLIKATEDSLRRLNTDYIDLLHLHHFDTQTPIEETLSTLDELVRSGKVRYLGVSNFAGWQVMKSLAVAERYGYQPYVSNQTFYSLVSRDYEWELMQLGEDQGLGALVWSPLGWGRLTGKFNRHNPLPAQSRLHETAEIGPSVDDELLYRVIDALEDLSKQTGKSVPQLAINWLLQRPTVSSVLIGARNEAQLIDNLAAADWQLSSDQVQLLDEASRSRIPYPYFLYWSGIFAERTKPLCS